MSATPTEQHTSDAATRQENFAAMSAVLTGFTADVVSPFFDPLQLVSTYLRTADTRAGANLVDTLIAQFLQLSGSGAAKQQIADTLLDTGNHLAECLHRRLDVEGDAGPPDGGKRLHVRILGAASAFARGFRSRSSARWRK